MRDLIKTGDSSGAGMTFNSDETAGIDIQVAPELKLNFTDHDSDER